MKGPDPVRLTRPVIPITPNPYNPSPLTPMTPKHLTPKPLTPITPSPKPLSPGELSFPAPSEPEGPA